MKNYVLPGEMAILMDEAHSGFTFNNGGIKPPTEEPAWWLCVRSTRAVPTYLASGIQQYAAVGGPNLQIQIHYRTTTRLLEHVYLTCNIDHRKSAKIFTAVNPASQCDRTRVGRPWKTR